jgi:hypothetical protein
MGLIALRFRPPAVLDHIRAEALGCLMAALTHTRFAVLALWYYAFQGAPGDADYQIDLKVSRQQRPVKIALQNL